MGRCEERILWFAATASSAASASSAAFASLTTYPGDSLFILSLALTLALSPQGDHGDSFFILDDGQYRVSIEKDGKQIEILRYNPNPAGAVRGS